MTKAQSPRPSTLRSTRVGILAPLVLVFACSGTTDIDGLNQMYGQSGASAAGTSAQPQAGSTGEPVGGQPTNMAGSGTVVTAGTDSSGAGTNAMPSGGTGSGGGSVTAGTSSMPMGGGGSGTGGSSGGAAPTGPYAPRTGTFKMLIYSKTAAFRHDSIGNGIAMLESIATEQGFTVKKTETNEDITDAGLKQYEIVFFMNSTGDIFNATEQKAFETWMTTQNGAMAGVHAATDTENGWAFYSDVTGQYYDGHGSAGVADTIKFEDAQANFPAVKGIPNPWQRNEEWYKFNKYQQWSVKPGFIILGRKTADTQPIVWAREWGNFRSFYTAIGHDKQVFTDPVVKKHLTGGIMWAVRREALIK
jgi:type 1 glutamine amidotransferase